MSIPESCPYYGEEETKNVIQFDTSDECTYVWNYNHILFEKYVKLECDSGVKSLFYKEIVYIIFEKLTNIRRISMTSNILYILGTYYIETLKSLEINEKNIIIEIYGGKKDCGITTKKLKNLDEWLTSSHYVELYPNVCWNYNHLSFGCPVYNISNYKYFKKIRNISTFYIEMFFTDQIEIEEVYTYCDRRAWFAEYNPIYSWKCFKNTSRLVFGCNNKFHKGCGLGILSWFPLAENDYRNYNLKELIYPMTNSDYFNLKTKPIDMISKIFPNITLLTLPASSISQNLKSIFIRFRMLKDIILWNVSIKQINEFIEFATSYSMDNYFIRTLYFNCPNAEYSLNVKKAIEIKKRFKYFEVDSKPVKIIDGKFDINCVMDFMLERTYNPYEDKKIFSSIYMSSSLYVLQRSEEMFHHY
ncbi:Hypothetical protein SRAE_1000229300 [Strongyloides ratti]|uniref:F-box domain-containing protein n=1 Tax=Strongyloides ratti TaxID=34506 RepID=A0A090L2V1_STRRB|nr:Hypothetical protein SRAE_1000229300 [Strongyloides ratti]CEF64037.1 Hypothetical protein SRAE_1000229300 [Strongyloides ratti]